MAVPSSISFPTAPLQTRTTGISAVDYADVLRVHEIDPEIRYASDGQSILYKLLMSMPAGEAMGSPKMTWFEGDDYTRYFTVSANIADSALAVVVTEAYGVANMILRNERTGEQIYVTSAAAGVTLTITRSFRSTTAAAMVAGDRLTILGANLPEGADANAGANIFPLLAYNYVQCLSTSVGVTDMQDVGTTIGDVGGFSEQERKAITAQMLYMDNILRWSTKGVSADTNSRNVWTTDGINATAGQDIDLSGTLTYADITDAFDPLFDKAGSSATKSVLAGPELFQAINRAVRDAGDVAQTSYPNVFGSNVKAIELANGFMIELYNDRHGMAGPVHGKQAFVIDTAFATLHSYKGMELQMRDITQAESHTLEREIFCSVMPCFKIPAMHGVVTWTA